MGIDTMRLDILRQGFLACNILTQFRDECLHIGTVALHRLRELGLIQHTCHQMLRRSNALPLFYARLVHLLYDFFEKIVTKVIQIRERSFFFHIHYAITQLTFKGNPSARAILWVNSTLVMATS